jgi:hypothetical protein
MHAAHSSADQYTQAEQARERERTCICECGLAAATKSERGQNNAVSPVSSNLIFLAHQTK